MSSVAPISFAPHPVYLGELREQAKEILRKVYRTVRDFFRIVCRTLDQLLQCGWRLLQRGISSWNRPSPHYRQRAARRRIYDFTNHFYTNTLPSIYKGLSYPQSLKEQLALYDKLPNEPVPFCRSLIELHRAYLDSKDKTALKSFNEELSYSLRFEDVFRLCIRGLIFTSKTIYLGESVGDQPDQQQIGPSCLRWHEWGESTLEKLKEMQTTFRSLTEEEKERFVNSFYEDVNDLAFTEEAKQLWLDIGKMVSDTLHNQNRSGSNFLQTACLPYTA